MATVPRFKDDEGPFGGKPAKVTVGRCYVMPTTKMPSGKLVSRDLKGMRSVEQQNSFAPTAADPIRMHHKLGGMA